MLVTEHRRERIVVDLDGVIAPDQHHGHAGAQADVHGRREMRRPLRASAERGGGPVEGRHRADHPALIGVQPCPPPSTPSAHGEDLPRHPRSVAQLGQQAQELEVEPDQRDEQAEGAEPLHPLLDPVGRRGLDEVEVED